MQPLMTRPKVNPCKILGTSHYAEFYVDYLNLVEPKCVLIDVYFGIIDDSSRLQFECEPCLHHVP